MIHFETHHLVNLKYQMENETKYYTIKLEALVPTQITYRVRAKDAEEALTLLNMNAPYSQPKQSLTQMKKIKATVYLAGSSIIKLSKYFT